MTDHPDPHATVWLDVPPQDQGEWFACYEAHWEIDGLANRDGRVRYVRADLADGLEKALAEAASTFREYERLHLAKDTYEGRIKAERNADLAERCEAALAAYRGETR